MGRKVLVTTELLTSLFPCNVVMVVLKQSLSIPYGDLAHPGSMQGCPVEKLMENLINESTYREIPCELSPGPEKWDSPGGKRAEHHGGGTHTAPWQGEKEKRMGTC